MGRATSGVTGMKFRNEDELLAADVVSEDSYVFVVTEGGYAKRTSVDEYRVQSRGGIGIKVAKLAEDRGDLVGALIVNDEDEVLVVMEGGKVVRSDVSQVPAKGRDTMGVIFAKPDKKDRIIAVAKNTERGLGENPEEDAVPLNAEKTQETASEALPGDENPAGTEENLGHDDEATNDGGNA
jgi:DNA gyrase subunit A